MDFNNNKPIYRQIVDYSFTLIISGKWLPGERVPSVRELAAELAVNSHTVLKAYEYLQTEGIIYPRRGMGFYLADDAASRVNDARRRDFFDNTLTTLFREMELLGISIDDIVARYHGR
ncbi:MAG: GntR family transcriptional regulator [Lachnoclostridium sp.]|nr:GntR family transcriptional regulator [Lachnoclostridium sp.]